MKAINCILLAASLLVASSVVAKPVIVTANYAYNMQDRHLSGFRAIQTSGSFDVYIAQGNTESVKVDASADDASKIITEVQNGVLKIYNKRSTGMNWNWGDRKRVVYVVVRNLESIEISGSGDVSFKNGIRSNALTLRLSGSGDVTGKLDVRRLETSLSGSGDIKLTGRAETQSVSLSGSGDFSGRGLLTANTSVRISGSGDAIVNASSQINAAISGSGDITYTGGAKQVSTSKTGSGDINRF